MIGAGVRSGGAPAVSVVLPAYNVSGYIAETLDSVFAQEFEDFEVIVVNDGSPDASALEVAIAPFRDRIIFLAQANAGPSAARNTAIRQARGKYLAFLDGDDLWLPHYLSDQVGRAEADPLLAVVYGDVEIIGDPTSAGKTARELNGAIEEANFLSLLSARCTFTTSCAMVRRDWCEKVGLFDPALRRSEDLDLWLRIANAGGRFGATTKVLAKYRRHGGGASSDLQAMADAKMAVMDKCERTLTLSVEARDAIARGRSQQRAVKNFLTGKQAFADGDFQTARRALSEANTVMRSRKLSLIVTGLAVAPNVLSRLYSLATARRR
ncbi:MAG: glycosyltransferase [Gemmatimonadaceae bacterium]